MKTICLAQNISMRIQWIILLSTFLCLVHVPLFATEKKNRVLSLKKDKISINFQDIPVRSLLQILAEHNDINLVTSDSIQGNLTLHLENVSWQKALNTVLHIKGLAKREIGNVLLIAPKIEMDKQAQQASKLAALNSEVIKINHANAEMLMNILHTDKAKYQHEDADSILSKRGSVAVDSRTNSLIVKDIAQNILAIKKLIAKLDVPVEQVEIEARIVSVDKGTLDEIGIRWGVNKSSRNYRLGGSIESIYQNAINNVLPENAQIDDYLNVNLGAASPNAANFALQVASLSRDILLDLELSVLQAESRAEIISSPRLITTNKRSAYIEQGTELPYLESSSSGAASVSFKKAVLSLSVTPQITNDKKLVLDLDVTQDRPSATVQAGTGEAVSINTQRVSTQVLVENGETVMLGGIYQNEMQKVIDKIPLLGDIPFIGWLFRHNYETLIKRELLIFVTPRIIVQ